MSKERLKDILKIQSQSYNQWRMFAYIIRKLSSMHGVSYAVDNGNIYARKGEGNPYPCIVAHMDTVHKIFKGTLSVIEVGDLMTGFNVDKMQQSGIGGDDKVGIYLALEMLEEYDSMKVVFFRDEEVGCHGSDLAGLDFFDDCAFVLQGDRRGNSDFITNASGTQLGSKAWNKALSPILKKHKYKTTTGMMTDVMTLKDNGLKISCANMSCGYYRPHSDDEYVNYADVLKCLDLMCAITDELGSKQWLHTPELKSWRMGGYYNKDGWWNEIPNKTTTTNDKLHGKYDPYWEEREWDYYGNEIKKDGVKRWSEADGFGESDESPLTPGPSTKLPASYSNVPVYGHCAGCCANKMVSYVSYVDDYICAQCETEFVW